MVKVFMCPRTDVYALGVLSFLLQKGVYPEGLPRDAPGPVQKALRGEYPGVNEFWADLERMGEKVAAGGRTEKKEGAECPK